MTSIAKDKIFRYKLNDDILSIVIQFAKIHQCDDRHTYKDAWKKWLKQHEECIVAETERLVESGYKGDVEAKMFIAGRYYFREKVTDLIDVIIEKKPEKLPKRGYIIMGKEIIEAMDKHLSQCMYEKSFKPALAYKDFCEKKVDLLRNEIRRLVNETNDFFTDKNMNLKIKKTYKNRYFMLSKSSNHN